MRKGARAKTSTKKLKKLQAQRERNLARQLARHDARVEEASRLARASYSSNRHGFNLLGKAFDRVAGGTKFTRLSVEQQDALDHYETVLHDYAKSPSDHVDAARAIKGDFSKASLDALEARAKAGSSEADWFYFHYMSILSEQYKATLASIPAARRKHAAAAEPEVKAELEKRSLMSRALYTVLNTLHLPVAAAQFTWSSLFGSDPAVTQEQLDRLKYDGSCLAYTATAAGAVAVAYYLVPLAAVSSVTGATAAASTTAAGTAAANSTALVAVSSTGTAVTAVGSGAEVVAAISQATTAVGMLGGGALHHMRAQQAASEDHSRAVTSYEDLPEGFSAARAKALPLSQFGDLEGALGKFNSSTTASKTAKRSTRSAAKHRAKPAVDTASKAKPAASKAATSKHTPKPAPTSTAKAAPKTAAKHAAKPAPAKAQPQCDAPKTYNDTETAAKPPKPAAVAAPQTAKPARPVAKPTAPPPAAVHEPTADTCPAPLQLQHSSLAGGNPMPVVKAEFTMEGQSSAVADIPEAVKTADRVGVCQYTFGIEGADGTVDVTFKTSAAHCETTAAKIIHQLQAKGPALGASSYEDMTADAGPRTTRVTVTQRSHGEAPVKTLADMVETEDGSVHFVKVAPRIAQPTRVAQPKPAQTALPSASAATDSKAVSAPKSATCPSRTPAVPKFQPRRRSPSWARATRRTEDRRSTTAKRSKAGSDKAKQPPKPAAKATGRHHVAKPKPLPKPARPQAQPACPAPKTYADAVKTEQPGKTAKAKQPPKPVTKAQPAKATARSAKKPVASTKPGAKTPTKPQTLPKPPARSKPARQVAKDQCSMADKPVPAQCRPQDRPVPPRLRGTAKSSSTSKPGTAAAVAGGVVAAATVAGLYKNPDEAANAIRNWWKKGKTKSKQDDAEAKDQSDSAAKKKAEAFFACWRKWQVNGQVPEWFADYVDSDSFKWQVNDSGSSSDEGVFVFNERFNEKGANSIRFLQHPRHEKDHSKEEQKAYYAEGEIVAGERLEFNATTVGDAEKDMNCAITRIVLAMSAVLRYTNDEKVIQQFNISVTFPDYMLRHLYYQVKSLQDKVAGAKHLNFNFVDCNSQKAVSKKQLAEWDKLKDRPLYTPEQLEQLKQKPEQHKSAQQKNDYDQGCADAMSTIKELPVIAEFKAEIEEAQPSKTAGKFEEHTDKKAAGAGGALASMLGGAGGKPPDMSAMMSALGGGKPPGMS